MKIFPNNDCNIHIHINDFGCNLHIDDYGCNIHIHNVNIPVLHVFHSVNGLILICILSE